MVSREMEKEREGAREGERERGRDRKVIFLVQLSKGFLYVTPCPPCFDVFVFKLIKPIINFYRLILNIFTILQVTNPSFYNFTSYNSIFYNF